MARQMVPMMESVSRGTASIRARCVFASGQARVVTVEPIVRPGDLFWLKSGRFSRRADSKTTIEVVAVDVARIQDMDTLEAIYEGVGFLRGRRYDGKSSRERFAVLWDEIHGAGAWDRNDWVWCYRFGGSAMPVNIDRLPVPTGAIRPLMFRRDMREAIEAGVKTVTRRLVSEINSRVQPGTFGGLQLETGRARRVIV